ncbi:MAG: hypothetical protein AB1393_08680 [Candidatus Edwardsbacteria bacterium]
MLRYYNFFVVVAILFFAFNKSYANSPLLGVHAGERFPPSKCSLFGIRLELPLGEKGLIGIIYDCHDVSSDFVEHLITARAAYRWKTYNLTTRIGADAGTLISDYSEHYYYWNNNHRLPKDKGFFTVRPVLGFEYYLPQTNIYLTLEARYTHSFKYTQPTDNFSAVGALSLELLKQTEERKKISVGYRVVGVHFGPVYFPNKGEPSPQSGVRYEYQLSTRKLLGFFLDYHFYSPLKENLYVVDIVDEGQITETLVGMKIGYIIFKAYNFATTLGLGSGCLFSKMATKKYPHLFLALKPVANIEYQIPKTPIHLGVEAGFNHYLPYWNEKGWKYYNNYFSLVGILAFDLLK